MDAVDGDPRALFEASVDDAARRLGVRIVKATHRGEDGYTMYLSEGDTEPCPTGLIVFDGEGLTMQARGYQRDVTCMEPEVDIWDVAFVFDAVEAVRLLVQGEGRDLILHRLIPAFGPVKCKEVILPDGRNFTFYPSGKFRGFLLGVPSIAL